MAMNPIEKLIAERQRLVERLEQIDQILRQYEEIQRIAEGYFLPDESRPTSREPAPQPAVGVSSVADILVPSNPTTRVPVQPKTPMPEFDRIVMEILGASERPLNRSALYEAVCARGVVIGSGDESSDLNTLSARMSRMVDKTDKVVNIKGYGYWPASRPFAEAGYRPELEEQSDLSQYGF
jgi:hypothetical protein